MASSQTLHCAAIDLGATSGRVILGTWARGRLALHEVHRFPNALRSVRGHDYWDIPGLWSEVQAGLRAAVAALPRGARLASVGVDTWGVDYVLVNDAGRIVFPTHAYRDARTQPGLAHLANTRAALARLYAATGIPAVFYNSSLQLAETVASCPAITDLATRCLFLPDYFNFLLSGRMANGLAIAGTTQLLDVHRPEWSRVALDHFRVPPTWLTPPVATGTKLGRLLPELAQTLAGRTLVGRTLRVSRSANRLDPLRDTQVIAVPGHDTTCAYDAIPAAADGGDILLSSGTWSLVGFESEQPLLGPGALAARVANDRTGRGGYRPLVNVIGLWLLEQTLQDFARRPTTAAQWTALIRATERRPAPARLLDVTDPAFAHPPAMRAAIDAHLRRHGARPPRDLAGYVRLICDSLGRGHADVIATLARLSGRTFRRILMVGGGSRNRLLCQATADAARLPVVSYALEGSAVGNLVNQLLALGAVRTLAGFRATLTRDLRGTTYTPRS